MHGRDTASVSAFDALGSKSCSQGHDLVQVVAGYVEEPLLLTLRPMQEVALISERFSRLTNGAGPLKRC